jgi:Domain of unknown function (DUF2017)
MLRRWRVKRSDGGIRINLPTEEREFLRGLMEQLSALISDTASGGELDDRVRRLFPTAYPDDPERDAEYHKYMREELIASHRASIERVSESLNADELTELQAISWTQSLNSVRLVLGTMLDISEETELSDIDVDDPEYGSYALYGYLSGLLDDVVSAF